MGRFSACFYALLLLLTNLSGICMPQFRPARKEIYNYCPSVMEAEDGTVYIYYCTNTESGNVTDSIGFRKGIRTLTGRILWSKEAIVLSPSEDKWDARHVCDPSVVAGEFLYDGETYGYLMAYLGCTSSDNQNNEIGLAAAKSPEGPFVKIGTGPFVSFSADPSYPGFQWGVGQPSVVSLDQQGRIVLFYTKGDKAGTRTICETWELSDLNAPECLSRETLGTNGLTDLNGGADILNNADFALDTANDRFVTASDCHPHPTDAPDYIAAAFRVTATDKTRDLTNVKWQTLLTAGKRQTFHDRNHNVGLLRDRYGRLPDSDTMTVFFTGANKGNNSLWSYRIYSYRFRLP